MIRLTRGGGAWLLVALVATQGSCAANVWHQAPRPLRGMPEEFAVDPAQPPEPVSRGCAANLVDTLSGSTLHLFRSTAVHRSAAGVLSTSIGDYEVKPYGRYGLEGGEMLRVECPSGRPVGAVH